MAPDPGSSCPICHGEGWAISWCYTCATFIHVNFREHHLNHHLAVTPERPCKGCGGTGKTVDLVRRRFSGDYNPE